MLCILTIEVLGVHLPGHHDLLDIGETTGLARFLAGLGEDREEDSCQDGDNGDHHQQLNERKTFLAFHLLHLKDVMFSRS